LTQKALWNSNSFDEAGSTLLERDAVCTLAEAEDEASHSRQIKQATA
jgi:hypothetical protein